MKGLKTCEICQQLQYFDTNDLDVIEQRIRDLTQFKDFAMIIHDKDVNKETNALKPPHLHIVIQLKNTMTIESIAKAIGVQPQYVNKIRKSTKSAYLYLVHRNAPEKYQYSVDEVRASFDYAEMVDNSKPLVDRDEIAKKISEGIIKRYNLYEYIDVCEYAHNKDFYEKCFQYRLEKINGLSRELECVYIYGDSATGKTTLARVLAEMKGFHIYNAHIGKNPFDNYRGEECILLDDVRGSNWSLSDFLRLTDNNTDTSVAARYYNKSIRECKLIIATSIKSLNDLFAEFNKETQEPITQLYRRFGCVIKMSQDVIEFNDYNPIKKIHEFSANCENTYSAEYRDKHIELSNDHKTSGKDYKRLLGFDDNLILETPTTAMPF